MILLSYKYWIVWLSYYKKSDFLIQIDDLLLPVNISMCVIMNESYVQIDQNNYFTRSGTRSRNTVRRKLWGEEIWTTVVCFSLFYRETDVYHFKAPFFWNSNLSVVSRPPLFIYFFISLFVYFIYFISYILLTLLNTSQSTGFLAKITV